MAETGTNTYNTIFCMKQRIGATGNKYKMYCVPQWRGELGVLLTPWQQKLEIDTIQHAALSSCVPTNKYRAYSSTISTTIQ